MTFEPDTVNCRRPDTPTMSTDSQNRMVPEGNGGSGVTVAARQAAAQNLESRLFLLLTLGGLGGWSATTQLTAGKKTSEDAPPGYQIADDVAAASSELANLSAVMSFF